MIRIKRVEVDEFDRVSAVEFYEDANPSDVMAFLIHYKIGRNFQPPPSQEDMKVRPNNALIIDIEAFMRP